MFEYFNPYRIFKINSTLQKIVFFCFILVLSVGLLEASRSPTLKTNIKQKNTIFCSVELILKILYGLKYSNIFFYNIF